MCQNTYTEYDLLRSELLKVRRIIGKFFTSKESLIGGQTSTTKSSLAWWVTISWSLGIFIYYLVLRTLRIIYDISLVIFFWEYHLFYYSNKTVVVSYKMKFHPWFWLYSYHSCFLHVDTTHLIYPTLDNTSSYSVHYYIRRVVSTH